MITISHETAEKMLSNFEYSDEMLVILILAEINIYHKYVHTSLAFNCLLVISSYDQCIYARKKSQ